jgi:hypothetical protein
MKSKEPAKSKKQAVVVKDLKGGAASFPFTVTASGTFLTVTDKSPSSGRF